MTARFASPNSLKKNMNTEMSRSINKSVLRLSDFYFSVYVTRIENHFHDQWLFRQNADCVQRGDFQSIGQLPSILSFD